MILAAVLILQELFFSLFITFWEVLTARPAPSGYTGLAKQDASAALSYDSIVLHSAEHQNLRHLYALGCFSGLSFKMF